MTPCCSTQVTNVSAHLISSKHPHFLHWCAMPPLSSGLCNLSVPLVSLPTALPTPSQSAYCWFIAKHEIREQHWNREAGATRRPGYRMPSGTSHTRKGNETKQNWSILCPIVRSGLPCWFVVFSTFLLLPHDGVTVVHVWVNHVPGPRGKYRGENKRERDKQHSRVK